MSRKDFRVMVEIEVKERMGICFHAKLVANERVVWARHKVRK